MKVLVLVAKLLKIMRRFNESVNHLFYFLQSSLTLWPIRDTYKDLSDANKRRSNKTPKSGPVLGDNQFLERWFRFMGAAVTKIQQRMCQHIDVVQTVQAGWMVLILQWKMMRFSERFTLVIVLPVVNTQERFLLVIHREIIAVFTLMLWYTFFQRFYAVLFSS